MSEKIKPTKYKNGLSALAWIGHKSYLLSPTEVVFTNRSEAKKAGWKNPSRIRITILKPTTAAKGKL